MRDGVQESNYVHTNQGLGAVCVSLVDVNFRNHLIKIEHETARAFVPVRPKRCSVEAVDLNRPPLDSVVGMPVC